jgi:hypothetical protein
MDLRLFAGGDLASPDEPPGGGIPEGQAQRTRFHFFPTFTLLRPGTCALRYGCLGSSQLDLRHFWNTVLYQLSDEWGISVMNARPHHEPQNALVDDPQLAPLNRTGSRREKVASENSHPGGRAFQILAAWLTPGAWGVSGLAA